MQDSFDSQYSTIASLAYNITDRSQDSRNITNVRWELEDFIRSHSSNRLPGNVLRVLKQQIKALFEMQYGMISSHNREYSSKIRSSVRPCPGRQVIPLYERDASHTRLEVYDPKHMIEQSALRRSQSQDLRRSINCHSSARVSQLRQPPVLVWFDSDMAPLSEQVSSSMRQERPIQLHTQTHPRSMQRSSSNEPALQLNSQSVQVNLDRLELLRCQGETKLKRISTKGYSFKRQNEPLIAHAIYHQRSSETPQTEEKLVKNSMNSQTLKKNSSAIKRKKN